MSAITWGARGRLFYLLLLSLAAACTSAEKSGELTLQGSCLSPDGLVEATVFNLSGGGAAGWSLTRVALHRHGDSLQLRDFQIEVRHGTFPALTWRSNDKLTVELSPGAVVHRADLVDKVAGRAMNIDTIRNAAARDYLHQSVRCTVPVPAAASR